MTNTIPQTQPQTIASTHQPKFSLGQIVATPGALEALSQSAYTAQALLDQHQAGDWGQLEPDDVAMNELALTVNEEQRLLSSYLINPSAKFGSSPNGIAQSLPYCYLQSTNLPLTEPKDRQ